MSVRPPVHVAEFLKTTATHLLFIDADIGFSARDVDCLGRGDFDVVAGAYPMKAIAARRAADHEKPATVARVRSRRRGPGPRRRVVDDRLPYRAPYFAGRSP